MRRDAGDIIDRYSIAKLKHERIGTKDNKREHDSFVLEFNELCKTYPTYDWNQFFHMMLNINDFIWQLESGLKSGKEKLKNSNYLFDEKNNDALAKIGTSTILIRNFNSLRVSLKNIINKLVGEGFMDIKKNHLSE